MKELFKDFSVFNILDKRGYISSGGDLDFISWNDVDEIIRKEINEILESGK